MPLCWLMTVFMVFMLMFMMIDLYFYKEGEFIHMSNNMNTEMLSLKEYKW